MLVTQLPVGLDQSMDLIEVDLCRTSCPLLSVERRTPSLSKHDALLCSIYCFHVEHEVHFSTLAHTATRISMCTVLVTPLNVGLEDQSMELTQSY